MVEMELELEVRREPEHSEDFFLDMKITDGHGAIGCSRNFFDVASDRCARMLKINASDFL